MKIDRRLSGRKSCTSSFFSIFKIYLLLTLYFLKPYFCVSCTCISLSHSTQFSLYLYSPDKMQFPDYKVDKLKEYKRWTRQCVFTALFNNVNQHFTETCLVITFYLSCQLSCPYFYMQRFISPCFSLSSSFLLS